MAIPLIFSKQEIRGHLHPTPTPQPLLSPARKQEKQEQWNYVDRSPFLSSNSEYPDGKVEVQKGKSFDRATRSLTTEIIQAQSQNASGSFE